MGAADPWLSHVSACLLLPSSATVQVTQGARGHGEEGRNPGWPPCQEEILLWLTVVCNPQPACPGPQSPSASSPSKPKVAWLPESALGLLSSNTRQGPPWLALCRWLASPIGRKRLQPGRLLFLCLEICSPFSSTPQYPLLPPPNHFSNVVF